MHNNRTAQYLGIRNCVVSWCKEGVMMAFHHPHCCCSCHLLCESLFKSAGKCHTRLAAVAAQSTCARNVNRTCHCPAPAMKISSKRLRVLCMQGYCYAGRRRSLLMLLPWCVEAEQQGCVFTGRCRPAGQMNNVVSHKRMRCCARVHVRFSRLVNNKQQLL